MSIKYKSTRGSDVNTTFKNAVLMGLTSDGGLLVPMEIPSIPKDWRSWASMSFQELALHVISCFVKEDEISRHDLKGIIDKSYLNFRNSATTPVIQMNDGTYMLELFHGPTYSFKDVALQFLGNLFEHILSEKTGDDARLTILGATSGDTGSSAIHAVRGKKGIECFILYPHNAVSDVQRRQMTTVSDENIHCMAIKGTFDDAQAIVKELNMDKKFKSENRLGAVNSINWARILAQIVYYFYAYFRVDEEKVSFSVPTGNFGDILAGFYAKRMGLPIDRLVCATNENNILEVFFCIGQYRRQNVVRTNTPSMDIGVSSNFERFLYHMCDTYHVKRLMETFERTSTMEVDNDLLKKCQDEMDAISVDATQRMDVIKRYFESDGYILDPHTSVGVGAAVHDPTICLGTAHWGKFPCPFSNKIPLDLERLFALEERENIVENNTTVVKEFILRESENNRL